MINTQEATAEPTPRWTRADVIAIFVLLVLSSVAALLRWKKLNTLVAEDPGWWLQESLRVAKGQVPYRDFAWTYPPLGLIPGLAMRWFGATFTVAQVTMDLVSAGVVTLGYLLLRLLMPRVYAVLGCVLLISLCITARTFFSLFSLLTYSPALVVSAFGLLLFMLSAVRYVKSGFLSRTDLFWWGAGSFIAMEGKQEPMLAIPVALVILAAADRTLWFGKRPVREWARHYLILGVVCLAPAALTDLWIAIQVGPANFAAAMKGYGLATIACPWWPTGLGIFGMFAALGGSIGLAVVLSLAKREQFVAYLGWTRQTLLWIAAGFGLLVYGWYDWYTARNYIPHAGSEAQKIRAALTGLLGTSAVLRPVMWAAILVFLIALFKVFLGSRQETDVGRVTLLVMLAVPVTMCVRSLFASTISPAPEVPAICYPLFTLLGPYLLMRFLELPSASSRIFVLPDRTAGVAVAAAVLLYSAIRIIGGYPTLLSNGPYSALDTEAGRVYLVNYELNRDVYRYIMDHTNESDKIFDGPYSGGMNFATRRLSPTYTTLFQEPTYPVYVNLDVERMRQTPPKLAILNNEKNYGILWGLPGNVGCEFPRFVWAPDKPSTRPEVMPIVGFLEQNYKTEVVMGPKVILVPR